MLGDGNAAGLTYTLGGTAFGIDYRLDPRFLVGIAGGYVGGTQWVNGFSGTGNVDALSVALYGSFTQGGFYADALAGYANARNRMQRVVAFRAWPPASPMATPAPTNSSASSRPATSSPSARPAKTSITPFGRVQVGSSTQAGFSESGSTFYNLAFQSQTTTSVRTTFGADFAASFDVGGGRPLDIGLRLGWLHEFADTARPITAAFAAAPGQPFTVVGATPQRDSAVVGFSAAMPISDRASAVRLVRRRSRRRHCQPCGTGWISTDVVGVGSAFPLRGRGGEQAGDLNRLPTTAAGSGLAPWAWSVRAMPRRYLCLFGDGAVVPMRFASETPAEPTVLLPLRRNWHRRLIIGVELRCPALASMPSHPFRLRRWPVHPMPIAVQSVVGFRCLPLSASTALRYAAGRLRPDLSLWLL